MKYSHLPLCFLLVLVPISAYAQAKDTNNQLTWTYTYLKAKEGESENLRKYLVSNWFAMDSIAVQKGLFNDYKLFQNTKPNAQTEWDFIVGVEYITKGTYSDIQEEWTDIRKNHKQVMIDGKGLKELGNIIKSEELINAHQRINGINYNDERIKGIAPFIGEWQEYLVTDTNEELYGKLKIEVDNQGSSIKKNFQHFQQPFTYSSIGYFDTKKEMWVETYVFSNGGHAIYEWQRDKNDFVLVPVQSSFKRNGMSRNRWTVINENLFQIIVEKSTDGGKTWILDSTTNMKRVKG